MVARIRARTRKRIYVRLAVVYGNRCWYCERSFDGIKKRRRTLDHLIPLSRGGSHLITNLVLCCSGCNNLKSDRTWWEYVSSPEYQIRLQKISEFEPKRLRKEALKARIVMSLDVPGESLCLQ